MTIVELIVGDSEVWLDGPVPDGKAKHTGRQEWVGFLVHDVDALHRRLSDDAVQLDPPRTRAHDVREMTVTDPEGGWGLGCERSG